MAKHRTKRRTKNRKEGTQTSLPPPSRSVIDRYRREPVKVEPDIVRPILTPKKIKPDLRPVEDLRRTPHDLDHPSFQTTSGRPARIETRPEDKVPESRLPAQVHTYFQDPERVLVCIRRESRKRVLFALRKVGKGKKVSRDRTYTEKSYMRCK